jgi:mono/diheme cytochrome c family protein
MMKRVIALIAAASTAAMGAAACASGAARAQEAGDAVKGAAVARQVCAECHAVERGAGPSPGGEAPAFERIAKTPGMTSIALTAALRTPHRRMPNIILSDDELKDVVAYLLSLK